MYRIFVHSTTPTPYILGHKGWWTWTLDDGTYLVAIAHDDNAFCRVQADAHPDIISVAPTRASGQDIPATMQTAVTSLTSPTTTTTTTTTGALTPTVGTGTVTTTTSTMTTDDMLNQIYSSTGDPAFHPEASL